jgi:hypothetical protein
MFTNIAYYLIFGKPLLMYLGIITLLCFLGAAAIGGLVMKGKVKPPFITLKSHALLARIGIGLAIIHGILGILMYF